MAAQLKSQTYGKHSVRVSKVCRPRQAAPNEELHEFVEASVNIELEGDFEAAYTEADNRSVIATDTCKNTVYALAKNHPLDSLESFGMVIGEHFLETYPQVSRCCISLSGRIWQRLLDSPHCFSGRDNLKPTAQVVLRRDAQPTVLAGFEQLMIAKTTESGFTDFQEGGFRTLSDTEDRILASEVSASWRYDSAEIAFDESREKILDALLKRFTDHYSRSVQETLYKMTEAALEACSHLSEITLTMPNKHHLLVDLSPFDLENENEVFCVTDEPFGYISATIERDAK